MEMRLRAPVTRGYFFLLGASRLANAASPRSIDQKKISSGTQGTPLPGAKTFDTLHGYTQNMQIRKTAGAIDGSLQFILRRLLAISASKEVE